MLDPDDWMLIQADVTIATTTANTYISLDQGFTRDFVGTLSAPITLMASSFTPNSNPPILLGGLVFLNNGLLGLMFSEGVDPNSVNVAGISFSYTNSTTGLRQTYTLTGGFAVPGDTGNQVAVLLTPDDLSVVRAAGPNGNILLTIAASTVRDTTGMPNLLQENVMLFDFFADDIPPGIDFFTLDLNSGVMNISFTEVIRGGNGGIDYSQLFLTNGVATSLSLAGSMFRTETTFVSTVVQIMLPPSTLNMIKRDDNLCSLGDNCFIIWGNNSFVDLSNNSAVEPSISIPVDTLVNDIVSPNLLSFNVDLMNGILNLTFSEPVNGDTFVVSAVTLTNGASQQQVINGSAVEGAEVFISEVSIILDSASLNFAKSLGTPQLAILRTATSDAAGNSLAEISVANSLPPMLIVPDQTPPVLLGFTPSDPSARQITLTFDEFVNTATWNGNQLVIELQVSAGDITYRGFTTGVLTPTPSNQITYTFSSTDFTGLFGSQYTEAYNSGAIVLRGENGLIQDLGGNFVADTDSFTYSTQPDDLTPPQLTGFNLDMNLGRLQLTFSEPVIIMNVSGQVQFLNSGDLAGITQVYDLANDGVIGTAMGPLPVVELTLDSTDVNALKVNRQLSTNAGNTFLIVRSALARDRNGNAIQPGTAGTPVSVYTADTSLPSVQLIDVNLNPGTLVLQFSEPVLTNSASLNFSQFRLGGSSSSMTGIGLGGSIIDTTLDFDSLLTIAVAQMAINSIKFDRTICTRRADCFLSYAASSFSDTAGNTALGATSGILAQSYFPDVTQPLLVSFDLDLDTGTFSLTFSEPIDIASFDLAGITFISQPSPSASGQYSPTEALIPTAESISTILTFMLRSLTLNQVKQVSTNNPGRIYLAVTPFAARDYSANSIVAILAPFPLLVRMLVPDTTAPTLSQFTPAAPNTNDITFSFDEFVDGNSFNENAFSISLTTRQGTFEYSGFRNGMITSNLTTDQLVYTFSSSDFNSTVSDQYMEAVSNGSVSLSVSGGLVTDIFGNVLPPLSTPLQFSTDSTRPTLLSYTLDLNAGILALTFSELVNIPSTSGQARLQNSAANPTEVVSLTQNGTLNPASAASDVITVQLGMTDLNNIKTSQNVGASPSNTFLAFDEMFAVDLSGNLLSPSVSATRASNVIPDTSRPTLSSFTLDINQGIVVLEFSESVVTSSLDRARLYLTGMPQSQPIGGYNLSDSTLSEPPFSTSFTLTLSQDLLNQVKSDVQICSSRSNCFAFVTNGAATDVSGNAILPSTTGVLASVVIADMVQPQLTAYTMDLDSGIIVLSFSEPVLVTGFNPSGIAAQAAGFSQQLGDTSIVSTESFDAVLRLQAGSNLLNQLKILDSGGTITISVNNNVINDTGSLSVVAIPPISFFAPTSFVPDTTPPGLLQFIPSSGQLGITLVFDEFIRPTTIAGNLLSFRLKNRNGQFDYSDLSRAITTNDISDQVTLTFPASETRFTDGSFLQSYALSFSEGSICLNLAPAFIEDVSGNGYAGNLLAVYTNASDTEQPELVSFTLNLNTSILNLTFSEGVNSLAVSGNVRLQASVLSSAIMFNLMNGTFLPSRDPSIVTIAIDPADLTNIMNIPSLATSVSNTYLFLSEGFAVDVSGNLLNTTQGAIQASAVTQVIRGTMILTFDLDLDSDIMTLGFDGGVNISTFNSSRITLTNTSSQADSSRVDVPIGRVELLSPPGSILTTFRFLFSVNDTVNIKRSTLCYQRSNCYASFMSNLIRDATGNSTFPVLLQVRDLFQDVTPPRLVAYREFDLNRGTFTLIFSEPVNGSSASFTDVQFSDRVADPTVNITLREGFTTPDHLEIDFSITREDLNAIKLIPGLCTSRDNCWVRLPSFFINDVGMNPFLHSSIQPDAQASFHQPIGFVNDATPPTLLSFDTDINAGVINLYFSEVIIQTTFYPDNITLVNAPNGGVSLRLSRDTAFNRSASGDQISLSFTRTDLNNIKSQNQLFTSLNTSYISLVTRLLVDTSANIFADILVSSPLQIFMFVPDRTRPNLEIFDLYNNDNGTIIISFDEPVDISTVDLTRVTLLAGPDASSSSFTLTGGLVSYLRPNDRLSLVVSMVPADLRAVKLITNLATGRENTYISITPDTVSDWTGNPVVSLPQTAPLQLSANGFVSDSSRASIAGYTFDLNAATMSLTFTDVLDISTLNLRQLTVQNSQTAPTESHTLMDSTSTSTNTDTFVVNLGAQDLTSIQSNLGLATVTSDTYISFGSSLVRDISGLEIIGVPPTSARGPAVYIADTTNPTLTSFSLDMNTGALSISFSEPVLVSALSLQIITLQNSLAAPTSSYTLTNGTYQDGEATASSVQVTFSYEDLNLVKSITSLASSRLNTFINITQDFVTDTNNNPIQPTIMQVMAHSPDTIPPTLLSFDLHLTIGMIELHFSEAISYPFGTQRNIVLQNTPFNPSVFRMLSQADLITTLPVLDTVQIRPSQALLLDLINNPNIAASTSTLYLSIAEGGFSDFASNPIGAIPSNGAMRVRFICKFLYNHIASLDQNNHIFTHA